MDTHQPGPDGLKATIHWLHRPFTDMPFESHEVLVEGDRAVARVTLHGRQYGPFVVPIQQTGATIAQWRSSSDGSRPNQCSSLECC